MAAADAPLRLFLDAGVIIEGCYSPWGASKGMLVLATVRTNYTVVLAEAIEREVQRSLARKIATLSPDVAAGVAGWLDRVRIERYPLPSKEAIDAHAPALLPAIRHGNDLPAVVTAILARPDWVLSTNTDHWNAELAARTGLRIATPYTFLRELAPRGDAAEA